MNEEYSFLEVRPLPLEGWWLLHAVGLADAAYVYRYEDGRWWLRDQTTYPNLTEYWIMEREDGAVQLVENPF